MASRTTIFVLISLLISAPAMALRCGSDLVVEGDSQSRVLKKCGEPESTYSRTIVRSGGLALASHGNDTLQQLAFDKVAVEIQVEEWEYSFGPRRFGRRILFENGRVVKIELMDYDK